MVILKVHALLEDIEDEAIRALNDICDTYQYLKECETTGIVLDNPEYVYYMPGSGGEMA